MREIQEIETIEIPTPRTAKLRILATSDLHMQMMAFDYVRDHETNGSCFAKLATLIHNARQEAQNAGVTSLLFDNGDTFQGTPVADVLARTDKHPIHPLIACMNYLGYDAGGLGNHDFDYGLDFLATCLEQHEMPVVCSNLTSPQLGALLPFCVLDRKVATSDGSQHALRIGVVSSLPDKTALWSRFHLEDRAALEAPLPCLQRTAAQLRKNGADIVVALAHMGLALFEEGAEAQNLVQEVAGLDDVDVVVGGHTHLRFPSTDHEGAPHADWIEGTVCGKPVAQPGASAEDLAVIDLELQLLGSEKTWRVIDHHVSLRPTTAEVPEDPEIKTLAAETHAKTRQLLSAPVARIAKPMHSFFALAHPSPVTALLAAAKHKAVSRAIADTEHANLPLVAVASTALTGGLDGPGNFLYVPAGEIKLRHIAGMNPYANNVWAIKTTGAQLLDWLERSAVIFNTLQAGIPDQQLVNPSVPGFRYDAIYGLEYRIDPSKPPRFDATGRPIDGRKGRVSGVSFDGEPLDPEQRFVVATTDHRAGGGGHYQPFPNNAMVLKGYAPLQQAVLDYLASPDCKAVRSAQPWSFPANIDRTAILNSAPQAADYLDDIAHLNPQICGETTDGFLRIRLHL